MLPLLIWMAGIVMETHVSLSLLSFVLLLVPAVMLAAPAVLRRKPELNYNSRSNWGIAFACILLFLSIQITAYHEGRLPHPDLTPLEEWAGRAREKLLMPVEGLRLTETDRSVVTTVVLGYNGEMSREVRRKFSDTGVVHILSVSGFHVAIVYGFVMRMLFFMSANAVSKWARYLIALLLVWIFTAISGLEAASVRSAIMITLYMTGQQLVRTTDRFNTLAASAFCMLVYNPFYLFDIGFQLSYTAIAFISYLQPRFKRLMDVRNPILKKPWEDITMTLSAQAGVSFLCLYYFERFPVLFLFTNLPLTIIATLLIPLALIWMLLPAGCPGYEILQSAVEALTRSMMWIVDSFSRVPGNTFSLHFNLETTILSYCALFFLFLYCKNRQFKPLLISFSIVLLIIILNIIRLFL
jgi:competence protein ComEC